MAFLEDDGQDRGLMFAFIGAYLGINAHQVVVNSAALVIADLTAANPNVYLEVGYAWGPRG